MQTSTTLGDACWQSHALQEATCSQLVWNIPSGYGSLPSTLNQVKFQHSCCGMRPNQQNGVHVVQTSVFTLFFCVSFPSAAGEQLAVSGPPSPWDPLHLHPPTQQFVKSSGQLAK